MSRSFGRALSRLRLVADPADDADGALTIGAAQVPWTGIDDLEVRLSLAGFGRSTATYEYEIVDVPTSRLIASAKTVQVWYDYDAGRSVAIDDQLKARLTQIVRLDRT